MILAQSIPVALLSAEQQPRFYERKYKCPQQHMQSILYPGMWMLTA